MATDDDFTFEPPEKPGPDNEANEARLQAELAKYQAAIESEFELGVDYEDGKLTPQQVKDRTEELLTQAVPKAVARLKHIVIHSTNDALALKASQYIIDRTMGKDGAKLVDPIADLFKDLDTKQKEAAN